MIDSTVKACIQACLSRWACPPSSQEEFRYLLLSFFSAISSLPGRSDSDKDTLRTIYCSLLSKYNYYSRFSIESIFKNWYEQLQYLQHETKATLCYSRIESPSGVINSSSTFLEEFKIINSVSNKLTFNIEKVKDSDLDKIDILVLFDDILGTGETLIKFMNRNKKVFLNRQIIVYCLEIMDEAEKNITEFCEKEEIDLVIFSEEEARPKAFHEDFIFKKAEAQNFEKILKEFELKLWGKDSDYILGFNNSQALVSLYRNTPNNTLSSFWIENDKWKGLFPRDNTQSILKKNVTEKKHVKYNIKKIISGRNK